MPRRHASASNLRRRSQRREDHGQKGHENARKHAGEEWAASHSEIHTVLALATEAKRNEHLGSIASYTDSANDLEGFYIAWWSETKNSHASIHLALSYGLPDGPGLHASRPAGADPAHDQMMLVGRYAVTSVYNVLKRMRHTAVADAILDACSEASLSKASPPATGPYDSFQGSMPISWLPNTG